MNTVQIGKIILANRKEKGVTQEELAKTIRPSQSWRQIHGFKS